MRRRLWASGCSQNSDPSLWPRGLLLLQQAVRTSPWGLMPSFEALHLITVLSSSLGGVQGSRDSVATKDSLPATTSTWPGGFCSVQHRQSLKLRLLQGVCTLKTFHWTRVDSVCGCPGKGTVSGGSGPLDGSEMKHCSRVGSKKLLNKMGTAAQPQGQGAGGRSCTACESFCLPRPQVLDL